MSTTTTRSWRWVDPPSSAPVVGASAVARRIERSTVILITIVLATGVIFGWPHLITPQLLGPNRSYTPFAVSGVSALTYDESSIYAAAVNYTALRNAVPYDTDVFEYQGIAVPTSPLPFFVLARIDSAVGGVERVFELCDFVLPPLALLGLYLLILDITGSRRLALIGSLTTLLVPFGPRNFLEVPVQLLVRRSDSIVQPLEYSRLIHPEFSFTLLVAALLLLWRVLRRGGYVSAVACGVLGGLLFYTYFYYFPVWVGGCLLLLLTSRRWLSQHAWLAIGLVNLVTWATSVPFWVSLYQSQSTANFSTRLARHASDIGHLPSVEKLLYGAAYLAIFGVLVGLFLVFGRAQRGYRRTVVLFHSAIFAAGLAAMNMEVVVGFNLEAILHFANRLFQPFLTVAGFTLGGPALAHLRFRTSRVRRSTTAIIVVTLLAIALARQTVVSINNADKHEFTPEQQLLFGWLNAHTSVDDVVVTSDRQLNDLLPVYTHNLVFVPNGERTSASDQEIERRFLTAMRLLQRPPRDVYQLLSQDAAHADAPLGVTYTYYLFVSGNDSYDLRLSDSALEKLVAEYERLDLSRELSERRVDYIYARGSESLAPVAGWTSRWVFGDDFGSLWRIERDDGQHGLGQTETG